MATPTIRAALQRLTKLNRQAMNKLKTCWEYKYMWRWCFNDWYALMFPHLVYSDSTNDYDGESVKHDARNFWETLNCFDQEDF